MTTNEANQVQAEDALWEVEDVMRYLKASRSWVYHAAQRGELPSLRISRMLRFDPAAVRSFALGKAAAPGNVVALRPVSR